jgi:polar amino acid transport system substrate-binding protein
MHTLAKSLAKSLAMSGARSSLIVAGLLVAPVAAMAADQVTITTEAVNTMEADAASAGLLPQSVRDAGTLAVSTFPNAPFTLTGEDGKLYGAGIDLSVALGKVLGLEASVEAVANVAASKVAVQSKRYALTIGPILDTPAAEKDFDVIAWVETSPGFVFAKEQSFADVMDFCGKRLAIVSGSAATEANMEKLKAACTAAGKPEQSVDGYGDQNAMIVSVLAGRADAAVLGSAGALFIADAQPEKLGALAIDSDIFGIGQYSGLGLLKDDPALSAAILSGMSALKANGVYDQIMAQYGIAPLALDSFEMNPHTK